MHRNMALVAVALCTGTFQDLLSGQYNNPIRVITFNTVERWSDDSR
jgi:hypothetical protein